MENSQSKEVIIKRLIERVKKLTLSIEKKDAEFKLLLGKKEAEFKLLLSEKEKELEDINEKAAGLFHDLANLMTAARGNVSLAKMPELKKEERDSCLEKATEACDKGTLISRQFMSYSKDRTIREVFVQDIIKKTVRLLPKTANDRQIDLGYELWPTMASFSELERVINNLWTNAEQSFEGRNHGVIMISGENISLRDGEIKRLPRGRYIKISVTDNGKGIPKELHDKVFQPHFTTKEKGNGIGLAISKAFVKKNGGELLLAESDTDQGATFEIYLPAIVKENQEVFSKAS